MKDLSKRVKELEAEIEKYWLSPEQVKLLESARTKTDLLDLTDKEIDACSQPNNNPFIKLAKTKFSKKRTPEEEKADAEALYHQQFL